MIKKMLRKNRLTATCLETYFFARMYLKPKGWFESKYLYAPIDDKGKPIPWFTYSFIHFLEQKVSKRPMKVFEFGSGNSTLWFSRRVESIVSVEHDTDYFTKMSKEFESIDNIKYEFRKLDNNYSQAILEYKNEFDIVVIDGRERVQCAFNSIIALKEDGIIIFDNSDRERYQPGYDFLAKNGFKKIEFKGIGAIGHAESQTTLFYRANNCFDI